MRNNLKRFFCNVNSKIVNDNTKKQLIENKKINNNTNLDNFSYGKFLKDNPNATKEERREAILNFFNKTR